MVESGEESRNSGANRSGDLHALVSWWEIMEHSFLGSTLLLAG